jgi:hypothetical protein
MCGPVTISPLRFIDAFRSSLHPNVIDVTAYKSSLLSFDNGFRSSHFDSWTT